MTYIARQVSQPYRLWSELVLNVSLISRVRFLQMKWSQKDGRAALSRQQTARLGFHCRSSAGTTVAGRSAACGLVRSSRGLPKGQTQNGGVLYS